MEYSNKKFISKTSREIQIKYYCVNKSDKELTNERTKDGKLDKITKKTIYDVFKRLLELHIENGIIKQEELSLESVEIEKIKYESIDYWLNLIWSGVQDATKIYNLYELFYKIIYFVKNNHKNKINCKMGNEEIYKKTLIDIALFKIFKFYLESLNSIKFKDEKRKGISHLIIKFELKNLIEVKFERNDISNSIKMIDEHIARLEQEQKLKPKQDQEPKQGQGGHNFHM